jgi:hypothetical protein
MLQLLHGANDMRAEGSRIPFSEFYNKVSDRGGTLHQAARKSRVCLSAARRRASPDRPAGQSVCLTLSVIGPRCCLRSRFTVLLPGHSRQKRLRACARAWVCVRAVSRHDWRKAHTQRTHLAA